MQNYFGAVILLLVVGMVILRVAALKKRGIKALQFGKLDKSDFLLPPFALFYFYLIYANTFNLPSVSKQVFSRSETTAWMGVGLCLVGMGLLAWSLVFFGRSFRIGIDVEAPDRLVVPTDSCRRQAQGRLDAALRARGFCDHPDRAVPDLFQLDPAGILRRGGVTVPPPSAACPLRYASGCFAKGLP